jgi:hypothetical protein
MRRDAEVFSNADPSEIRGQNLGVVGTNRAARGARFADYSCELQYFLAEES